MDRQIRSVLEEFFQKIGKTFNVSPDKLKEACFLQKGEKKENRKEEKKEQREEKKENKMPRVSKKDKLFADAMQFALDEIPSAKNSVVQLKEMCKKKGFKVSGKKEDLIFRLNNPQDENNIAKGGKGGKKAKKFNTATNVSHIIAKLSDTVSGLAIRKNDEGLYIDSDTKLVFNPQTLRVYGRWKNNKLGYLNKDDIEVCKKINVLYDLPENLNLDMTEVIDKKLDEELGEDDFKEDVDDDEEEDEDEEI